MKEAHSPLPQRLLAALLEPVGSADLFIFCTIELVSLHTILTFELLACVLERLDFLRPLY